MFPKYRQIPQGLQDTLPGENLMKRNLEEKIRRVFALSGFAEIETPLLEYLDLFAQAEGGLELGQMWKTLDSKGNILVMRPEGTTPVLRLAATGLSEAPLPLRLSYLQDRLEYSSDIQPLFAQTTQAGVELLGEKSPLADAEIVALAIDTLRAAGLEQFLIDLGQVDFFRGMIEEAGLSPAQEQQLQTLVEAKNLLGMERFLRIAELPERLRADILRLPSLYGGEEVLAQARALTDSPRSHQALDRIEQVIGALSATGRKQYVSIDLGLVHEIHYYSGLIFRGLTSDLGKPLLSGGRYDGMAAALGRSMPAIGFALDIKRLLIALERKGAQVQAPGPDVLLGYRPACMGEALAWVEAARAQGQRVEIAYDLEREALSDLALQKGAARCVWIDETGVFDV